MRIVIGSRQSDLARLQSYLVAETLKKKFPELEVEFYFKASFGDKNLDQPLWKLPQKGVFTEDFLSDLRTGRVDCVVHSWKDLPTEAQPDTEIAATLHRADMRDVLLFKKTALAPSSSDQDLSRPLCFLTSSPRRAYNLNSFLVDALPQKLTLRSLPTVETRQFFFKGIRGNVPTRFKKFADDAQADGFIVAKAALDRLLFTTEAEFSETRATLRRVLDQCVVMVLPLTANPAAAAQGALAVEIKRDRRDMRELLRAIHCVGTFETVVRERQILQDYGGGCHQKIGVSVLDRDFGRITFLRGHTDAGEILESVNLQHNISLAHPAPRTLSECWPIDQIELQNLFSRTEIANNLNQVLTARTLKNKTDRQITTGFDGVTPACIWVAKEAALPKLATIPPNAVVWTAGLKTWKKLAARNIWVSGSAEGLGEQEDPCLAVLLGFKPNWIKLTHADASGYAEKLAVAPENTISTNQTIATYNLTPKIEYWNSALRERLQDSSHFFWTSYSHFREAVRFAPEILSRYHFCGPGGTYQLIRQDLPLSASLEVCLSHAEWVKWMGTITT